MKKILRNSIIITVLLIIAGVYSYGNWGKAIYVQNATSGDNSLTNELIGNSEIKQTFLCKYNGLTQLEIKMLRVGTEEIKGYAWSVYDADGNELATGKISENELANRKFKIKKKIVLNIPEQKNSKGKEYTLCIKGNDVAKEGCFQAYITEGNKYAKQLLVDGNEVEQSLVLKVITHRFNMETFFVFIGLTVYVGLFFKIMYKLFK